VVTFSYAYDRIG